LHPRGLEAVHCPATRRSGDMSHSPPASANVHGCWGGRGGMGVRKETGSEAWEHAAHHQKLTDARAAIMLLNSNCAMPAKRRRWETEREEQQHG
jgi:hypothetical protein